MVRPDKHMPLSPPELGYYSLAFAHSTLEYPSTCMYTPKPPLCFLFEILDFVCYMLHINPNTSTICLIQYFLHRVYLGYRETGTNANWGHTWVQKYYDFVLLLYDFSCTQVWV